VEYEAERAMPAPAEVVFDTVADRDLLGEWLPGSLHVTGAGHDLVHAEGTAEGRDLHAEGVFGADREQLRVEWGSRGEGDYAGWVQVYTTTSEASSVTLHLSFFANHPQAHPGPAARELQSAMEESLRRLEELVRRQVRSG